MGKKIDTTHYKRFISFEGIDFCGKSTQINALLERLTEHGISPLLVREPGGTVISEKIRAILLSPAHREMHMRTEIFLYEAARAQLVHQKILPALQTGKYVIADRFFDSTTAYQGYGRRLDLEAVKLLNRFATAGLKPYRTFFIDISVEEAERRGQQMGRGRDRLESGGRDFFQRVRQGFLKLCKEETERFVRIDGERPMDIIAREIWEIVRKIWEL